MHQNSTAEHLETARALRLLLMVLCLLFFISVPDWRSTDGRDGAPGPAVALRKSPSAICQPQGLCDSVGGKPPPGAPAGHYLFDRRGPGLKNMTWNHGPWPETMDHGLKPWRNHGDKKIQYIFLKNDVVVYRKFSLPGSLTVGL